MYYGKGFIHRLRDDVRYNMMIPVRCFTCGKLIADKYEEWKRRVKEGEESDKVLDDLGLTRLCCRRMIISHVELIDDILPFNV